MKPAAATLASWEPTAARPSVEAPGRRHATYRANRGIGGAGRSVDDEVSQPSGAGPDPEPSAAPVRRFEGGALMAVGGMIVLLCGSCTAYFGGNALWDTMFAMYHDGPLTASQRYDGAFGPVVGVFALVVGGAPTAVGVWAFLQGYRRYRQSRRATP